MKHYFFRGLTGLLLGVMSFMFVSSCTKDDFSDKNIIGKWQSTSITFQSYESGKLTAEETEKCIDSYIGFYFKTDGSGQFILYDAGESNTVQITWVIMGDKLMISSPDTSTVSLTFNIISIKGNSMTLENVSEKKEEGVKYVTSIYFKKI